MSFLLEIVVYRFAKEICDAIVAKCLTGRPKTVEKAQAVFMLWVELEAADVFLVFFFYASCRFSYCSQIIEFWFPRFIFQLDTPWRRHKLAWNLFLGWNFLFGNYMSWPDSLCCWNSWVLGNIETGSFGSFTKWMPTPWSLLYRFRSQSFIFWWPPKFGSCAWEMKSMVGQVLIMILWMPLEKFPFSTIDENTWSGKWMIRWSPVIQSWFLDWWLETKYIEETLESLLRSLLSLKIKFKNCFE